MLQRRASRRMSENDAWLVATAESIGADVVGADRAAFERLGARYLRFC
jgi:predicted nucleic acid-binding protein